MTDDPLHVPVVRVFNANADLMLEADASVWRFDGIQFVATLRGPAECNGRAAYWTAGSYRGELDRTHTFEAGDPLCIECRVAWKVPAP